jgi:hypothetical protein
LATAAIWGAVGCDGRLDGGAAGGGGAWSRAGWSDARALTLSCIICWEFYVPIGHLARARQHVPILHGFEMLMSGRLQSNWVARGKCSRQCQINICAGHHCTFATTPTAKHQPACRP